MVLLHVNRIIVFPFIENDETGIFIPFDLPAKLSSISTSNTFKFVHIQVVVYVDRTLMMLVSQMKLGTTFMILRLRIAYSTHVHCRFL